MDDFFDASRCSMNVGKCHIFGWNVTQCEMNAIAISWGFSESIRWNYFKYLGMPIFQKNPSGKDWIPLLDKFKSKLQAWEFSWLNLAGKTVLIK